MSHFSTMLRVILPQAVRNIMPQIGNNLIINIKDTSVLNVIGVVELYFATKSVSGAYYTYFEAFSITLVIYLVMTVTCSRILRLLERKIDGADSYDLSTTDTLAHTSGLHSPTIPAGRGRLRGSGGRGQKSMSETILQIRHLTKSFGSNLVLKDIDFSVEKGQVVSIIGSSGSGKSTLLRCINLLETPSGGTIYFHGEDISAKHFSLSKYRAKVGMVFQQFNLFNNLTVLENCVMPQMNVLRRSRAAAEEQAKMYLSGSICSRL